MVTAFVLCACVGAPVPKGAQAEHTAGEYRVEFEVVLAPTRSDTAVYRARVWTVGQQDVLLNLDAGQIAVECAPRAEPGGKLFRTDVVIVANVRTVGAKRELERVFNCGGELRLTDELPAGAELADLTKLREPGTINQKLGADVPLGKLNGKTVTIKAREARR